MQFFSVLAGLLPLFSGSVLTAAWKFEVWPTADCSGAGTVISSTAVPAKGNFNPRQGSFKILELASNLHLTFYTGSNQSGDKSSYDIDLVGGPCVRNAPLSYGIYTNYPTKE